MIHPTNKLEGWDRNNRHSSSTSLCLSLLEDAKHFSTRILMWYLLLNRVVVMTTQQGLAPLFNVIHFEVIGGLSTEQAYGNPHKKLKEQGSSKARSYLWVKWKASMSAI